MKNTPKPSQNSEQRNSTDKPSVVIDLSELLAESNLSEDEQRHIKKVLIESPEPFGKWLQWLVRQAQQTTAPLDIHESLKQLEEQEGREIISFESLATLQSQEIPQLQFLLDELEIDAEKTQALVRKVIDIKQIADVIFEASDKNGHDFMILIEFENQYQSDEEMDNRKLQNRRLMAMDENYQRKTILDNVFYFTGSPTDKPMIEDRTVKLPTEDSRYPGEFQYKAYHLNQMTIETIINRKLAFLLPIVVESKLRSRDDVSTNTSQILQKQIDEHEVELTQMIEAFTDEQMESMRTTVEYLWGKSDNKETLNQSSLLTLIKEQLNVRYRQESKL
jgi:hypothetical protein